MRPQEMRQAFTIGVDYGTSSVRALVVDCADGRELGTAVFDYPSGEQGVLLDPRHPHLARQNPADYVLGLQQAVNAALATAETEAGFSRQSVIGIGVDTTGSTPDPGGPGEPAARARAEVAGEPRGSRLAVEGPHRRDEAAAITRTAREHAPAVPREVRRHLLVGVVLVEDLALPEGRARGLRGRAAAGSSSPTSCRRCSRA